MKVTGRHGRKTSTAYELYGFIPRVDNGKHTAICMSCNRLLQNTAAVRLQKHRNSCLAARNNYSDLHHFPNIEIKRNIKPKSETVVPQNGNINLIVKTELNNMHFEDENINENAHDNTTYEETSKATNQPKLYYNTSTPDEFNSSSTILSKQTEPSKSFHQEENPIQLPITAQQQTPEPFESYHATITTNNSALDINDDIEEVNDRDLINIEEELDAIQNLMPRSKESKKLQDELSKAEAEYYRCKAAYFKKLTENCKVKRTLMLLESRKLQLEIEKLTSES